MPAVTSACVESRKYSSYVKAFTTAASPRFIWTNFDRDHIQMLAGTLRALPHVNEIKHLRFDNFAGTLDEPMCFYLDYLRFSAINSYPNLQSVHISVNGGQLRNWTGVLRIACFGVCPEENVRIVDRSTGEWIDKMTCDGYRDWVDSNGGEHTDRYTRVVEAEDEALERADARKRLQIPLPRMKLLNLDDWLMMLESVGQASTTQ
jgi:hypothetical protein